MSSPTNQIAAFEAALLANAPTYDVKLSPNDLLQLTVYYQLINTWNPRLHLVAPCSAEEFAQRHILESLVLLRYLPDSASVVDVGSGAGLPIIPCLIVRDDISALLIEAAKRKAVFLREALKAIGRTSSAKVIAERFETVATPAAQFITSRALDRFGAMLPKLVEWAPHRCTMLLFGGPDLEKTLATLRLPHSRIHIPNSEKRFLFVVEVGKTQ
ncbi:MAG TPA: RsmG family class I SAM-dependent methyltransferase [Pyrinomonadaceae bacterium]|nr:RsmG family class I SAM-dependent methyltransferase [Pyrinomonadaceae bacterium]